MNEFIDKIFHLTYWEIMTDIHGGLAMLSLILFGAVIVLLLSINGFDKAVSWLKRTMLGLFITLTSLNLMGLFVYRPYRAKVPTSPRTILLGSEDTAWLHQIIFEHKEFLALVPMIIIMTATIIVLKDGKSFRSNPLLKRAVLFAVVTALIFVLVVAAEAVLVTKAAPIK